MPRRRSYGQTKTGARAVGPSVSDGRLEIFGDFSAGFEPVTELSAHEHLVLDTSREPETSLAILRGRWNSWPKGFTG
jgi:hypothetical protein